MLATHQSVDSGHGGQMMSWRRRSVTECYELTRNSPIPGISRGGARVKVYYAGAGCYTDTQIANSGQRRPRMKGVMDTSLFPGFEVSGTVDELCRTVNAGNSPLKVGDKVVVYPANEEEFTETGYAEFMLVNDVANLIKVPDELPLDIAATLPCGALAAFAAVDRVRPFVIDRLEQTDGVVNVLIVGAGSLGLWTLRVAEYYLGLDQSRVRLVVADNNLSKLEIARDHGCSDVIHWCDELHEEYIEMRTRNVCKGGVDAVIDFASSARTVGRAFKVLKEGGVIVVGGNSKFDVPLCLHTLATKGQSVLGVHRGTRDQLRELVYLVALGRIVPPTHHVYPVEEADAVFRQLSECRINGSAILRLSVSDSVVNHGTSTGSFPSINGSSVFCSVSADRIRTITESSNDTTEAETNEPLPTEAEPMVCSSSSPTSKGSGFFLP